MVTVLIMWVYVITSLFLPFTSEKQLNEPVNLVKKTNKLYYFYGMRKYDAHKIFHGKDSNFEVKQTGNDSEEGHICTEIEKYQYRMKDTYAQK